MLVRLLRSRVPFDIFCVINVQTLRVCVVPFILQCDINIQILWIYDFPLISCYTHLIPIRICQLVLIFLLTNYCCNRLEFPNY